MRKRERERRIVGQLKGTKTGVAKDKQSFYLIRVDKFMGSPTQTTITHQRGKVSSQAKE